MDFGYLIELAKANEERDRKEKDSIKFSTNVSHAKKVVKAGPKVDAIKKILSQKEEDKKKQDEEYNEKRSKLLALRAQDKKSNKRVLAMINRTKGASKSVLEDAKDITTAVGEEQCDEDDYGYESTYSQQIFAKLKTNYSEIPEDERLTFSKTKKSNIADIKSRVLSSLKQEQEEDLGLRKRKRNRKKSIEDDGFINDGDSYKDFKEEKEENNDKHHSKISSKKSKKSESKMPVNLNVTNYKSDKYSQFKYSKEKLKEERPVIKEEKKVKIKKAAPPPMSFEELMKVAQKKLSEPLPVENPLELIAKKKKEKEKELERDRPLTAKEKMELEEEKMRKLKKIWKLSDGEKDGKDLKKVDKEEIKGEAKNEISLPPSKESKTDSKKLPEPPQRDKSKYFAIPTPGGYKVNQQKSIPNSMKNGSKEILSKSNKESLLERALKSGKESQTLLKPKNEVQAPRETGKVMKKMGPPKSVSRPTKTPPPPRFPIKKQNAPPPKRIIDSDEDEYDSDMDDFIDDGEADLDYSSEIARMFKYDKNKYRDIDEDVDDMEASYNEVEKEERISAKLGLMEDLQDIEREEAEKKRKKMMMMKSKGKVK